MKRLFKTSGKVFLTMFLLGSLLFASVMNNTRASGEEISLFHDVVDVAAGIQYLAALKSDGTVSLAKLSYSFEPGSEEEKLVDFANNEYRIPVDMGILQSEVSEWRDIESIEVFRFSDDAGYDQCEILVGLDKNGKLHLAGGFSPRSQEYYHDYVLSYFQVDDWSDVISFSTCRRLLMGVRSDGRLYLTGCIDGAENIESLAENASNALSVKLTWSNQGPFAACLFRDGRLGMGDYDYEKDEWYIRYLAEDVQDFDVSQSITVALHTDGTVSDSWWENKVFDWPDVAQVCAEGAYICVVKQNGDVFRVTPDGSEQFELLDIGFKDIKHIYTNHSGNRMYGILGLKNDGSIVTELTEHAPQIDLSDWTDIADIFFPAEDIVYVAGLKQDGRLIVSDNVTAEVY